ncbi:MAG: hypothetical protein HND44_16010 [Chloroflexi bacterium]|nr:N-acetylmuramoyl-L-alanine amidase [Ardenticatenaceae bacterium]MBL1129966.1 hypothetical protein [Chloroflexota bacterium]NOG36052.1 hypothetical protein [Chloroflexota bacterium]GIK56501.1 MAG: hypothetical protein BroJett015_21640 [Chloroflexota bacterium]
MQFKTLTILTLFSLLVALGWTQTKSSQAQSTIEIVTFQGETFAGGESQGMQVTTNGLEMADTAVIAHYQSAVIHTPIAYNAAVTHWLADIPESASLEIHLRTSPDGQQWSEWYDIHAHADWNEPGDAWQYGDMVAVPAVDKTHHYLQFQVSAARYWGGPAPLLRQLDFVLIDTSNGPTTAELIARQQELDAANPPETPQNPEDFPRPFVITRAAWCTQPECWYSGLDYQTYTHLLMHHTVTSSGGDSAAIVRAIWEYHTFTQGWGDIGYNYLIDINGVIFEGHLNGNYHQWDVTGVHAGAANAGGMAASLIGNFTSPDEGGGSIPSTAMLNALADLFAWKADQRDIDPFDASRMVQMSWGLPHIMGHRDVYGGLNTLCPGSNAYNYLPWLRNAVASRIGFVSPYIHIDEMSSSFTKSNANWYEGPRGCGNNGHSYYTWSTTDPNQSTNWGEWRFNVPVDGRYRIQIYAPYCNTGAPETIGARYTVYHATGTSSVTVNQDANVGLWMTVGEFDLTANSNNRLRLTDLTTTDNGRGVWFDGIRLLHLGQSVSEVHNSTPAPDVWVTANPVEFTWQIVSTAPVVQTQLQVATDAAMNNLVYDQTWSGAILQHSHIFTQDYAHLYWWVKATVQPSGGGSQTVTSTATHFRLDTTPPTSSVNAVLQLPNAPGYSIHWSGTDEIAGITHYFVEYRPQGGSDWTVFVGLPPLATSTRFVPPDSQVYEFRSRAIDAAGNAEPAHITADISTDQAILLTHAIMLPVIRR